MKFVCNNCGFTAEIPVRRTTCPMCGSSNVSSSAETMTPPEKSLDEDEEKTGEIKTRNARSAEGPTQRVTVTEGLSPAKQGKSCKKGCKCKLAFAVILILVLAALAAVFFFLQ